MSLKRDIRKAHQVGAFVYATLEALAGGYATVRLAENGRRIANLPCTTQDLRTGDQVFLDYSAGIPPAVIPVTGREATVATTLQLAKAASRPEEISTVQFSSLTDISVKLRGCTNVGAGESWEPIAFTDVLWDTATFFDPLVPTRITFYAGGIYLLTGKIGMAYPGVIPHMYYQLRFYSPDSSFGLPIASDFPIVGQNEATLGFEGFGPFVGTPIAKRMNVCGLGAFKAGEYAELQIKVGYGSSLTIINDTISPVLEAQLLGQIGDLL